MAGVTVGFFVLHDISVFVDRPVPGASEALFKQRPVALSVLFCQKKWLDAGVPILSAAALA